MESVEFLTSVGGDGSIVTDDANPTTGLANGGHRLRFVPALSQVVAVAGNTVTKATEAAASAAVAHDWAIKTDGPVSGGEFGAKYHAQAAAISAASASDSAASANASANSAAAAAAAAADDAQDVADALASIASGPVYSINGETGNVTLVATEIPFSPSGGIAANNVGAALVEIDSEKASKTGVETLTNKTLSNPILSLSGSNGAAGQVLASQGYGQPATWTNVYTPPAGVYSKEQIITSSFNFIVPAGTTKIRAYAVGAGAGASTSASGAGGGMASGDIAVTPSETLTCTISGGAAIILRGATEILRGNPASGITAGTAAKNASVTNGGAYSGGAGVNSDGAGGASAGSPLGAGKNATAGPSGGAGINSQANGTGGGNGGGGNGGNGSIGGGPRMQPPYSDPLIARCVGAGGNGSSNNGFSIPCGNGNDGGGGGGYSGTGAGIGGNGGFGAGGGGSSGNGGRAGNGGHLGGGGGVAVSGIGGNGGFGGGGGVPGGAGGPAAIWIYYQ